MANLFDTLVNFYERINWKMAQVPNETILSVTYQGQNGQWVFVASSDEVNDIIVMFARAPETCPKDRFREVNRFMGLSNFGMTHGAWVMDFRDGEIRFRLGLDAGKLKLSDEYLRDLTLYTNMTMDRYLPALKAILQDNKSAEEAIAMVFPAKAVK